MTYDARTVAPVLGLCLYSGPDGPSGPPLLRRDPALSQAYAPRHLRFLAVAIAALSLLPVLRYAWHRLPVVRGWEADDIARNLVNGYGFEFSSQSRWLWDKWHAQPGDTHPTAWVDPVFTFLLAGAHAVFEQHAYLAIYLFSFICIAVIFACVYRLASRFGSEWTGVLAVALLAMHVALFKTFFGDISNSAMATAMMSVTALVAVRYFERSTRRRLVELGLMSGLLVLSCPAAQYSVILVALAIAWHHRRHLTVALPHALSLALLAALVISPWTLRNYLVFDELVLVRNGAGQIAWDGTVGPAATFLPDAARTPVPAPWRSTGPRDAVWKMTDKQWRLPMHRFQVASVAAAPPLCYEWMNEAQRDKFYMSRAVEFIARNPAVVAAMAIVKIEVFLAVFGRYGVLLAALAVFGALLAGRDPRSWPVALAVLGYSAPFVLVIAYYGRYRAPVEPLIVVLAAVGLWLSWQRLRRSAVRHSQRERARTARRKPLPGAARCYVTSGVKTESWVIHFPWKAPSAWTG